MVAIKDASKVAELKEAIKGVSHMPEILVGDEGAVEVARHKDAGEEGGRGCLRSEGFGVRRGMGAFGSGSMPLV